MWVFDILSYLCFINSARQAIVEKILKTLTVDNKDIRKGDWTNKEVRIWPGKWFSPCSIVQRVMKKSITLELTQLVEEGVTPQNP